METAYLGMGYQVVADVFALSLAGRLDVSAPARCVLLAMAHAARDTPSDIPERYYFGGHRWLAAAALGRDKYDNAAAQAVWRAISELRRAGLIADRGRLSGPQSHAIYEVTLSTETGRPNN